MDTDNNAVEDFPEVHCSGTIYKQCKTQIEKKETQGKMFSVISISYTVMVM